MSTEYFKNKEIIQYLHATKEKRDELFYYHIAYAEV